MKAIDNVLEYLIHSMPLCKFPMSRIDEYNETATRYQYEDCRLRKVAHRA